MTRDSLLFIDQNLKRHKWAKMLIKHFYSSMLNITEEYYYAHRSCAVSAQPSDDAHRSGVVSAQLSCDAHRCGAVVEQLSCDTHHSGAVVEQLSCDTHHSGAMVEQLCDAHRSGKTTVL